jgi:O-antigen/teichoic acid export membrane protein
LNKTLNHSYIYISGSLIQALVPFALIPILTRQIPQSHFGFLMLLISIGTVLSFGFSLGIPAILSRELIFQRQKTVQLKNIGFRFQSILIWASILILLLSIFLRQIMDFNLVLLSIALALSLSSIQIKLSILRAEFKSYEFALLAIFSTALPMIVITSITFSDRENIVFFYVFSTIVVSFVSNISQIFVKLDFYYLVQLRSLVSVGFPMVFHGMAISLFQYGDKIASFLGLGSVITAQVVIISLFMTAPMLLLSTINNAWLPSVLEVFQTNDAKGFQYLNKTSQYLSAIITLIAVGLVLFSKFIVVIFVPGNYNQIEISKAIILGLSFSPLYIIYLQNTHLLTITKKFKTLAKITPFAAVIQFLFTYLFINYLGLNAAAYGLLIAILIQVVLTTISARSFIKLNKMPFYSTLLLSVFNLVFLRFFI